MTADEDDSNPTPAEPAVADSVTAESGTETAPAGQPLRPRRRRRRRRNPVAAATAGAAAPGGEASDGTAPPTSVADGPAIETAPARVLGENTLRLRTRSPRRRRRPPGIRPAGEAGPAAVPEAVGEDAANSDASENGAAAAAPNATPRLGPDGQPLRRRRRRRRPPQLGGAGDKAAGDVAPTETGQTAADPNRPPRRRNNRPGVDRPGDHAASEGRAGAPREPRRDRREGGTRGPRDGDNRRGSPSGQRGRRDDREGRGGRGRGRDDRPARVERKLYTLDSVVDRGFEDVEEESGTRRVTWTIVKRTVADQITRKPMSQNYVLQRDGVDSEFPSLGAARDAVNKRIVHPEKLTLSKAEHAAQKSGR